MLQIISGKFFDSEERHQFDAYTPLYSNFFWVDSVELEFTKLFVDLAHVKIDSCCYTLHYKNQIEKDENFALVRVGDWEILQQFQDICTFGLQAIFDSEENIIANLCKPKIPYGQNSIPSEVVKRYFEPKILGNLEEIEQFKILFKKIIDLPREDYKIIIKCIGAFTNSLKILDYNFDLAYSMLIYCLETISQNYDGFESTWNDYEKSSEMDDILENLDEKVSNEIRDLIVSGKHSRLKQRFTNYIIQNTNDNFFTTEARNIEKPLRRSEFEAVLKNAYDMRSSYAHSLQPILEHIKNPHIANVEIFTFSNQPYFTYNGLLRITHHIIKNTIFNGSVYEKEKIDWKSQIPGTLQMELDSSYWIGNIKGFMPITAKRRLSAFLNQYFSGMISKQITISDCSDLMTLYESKIFNSKQENRRAMVIHYLIYNLVIQESNKSPQFQETGEEIMKRGFLEEPCIENLFFCTFTNQKHSGTYEECKINYNNYKKRKTQKYALVLPQLAEIILLIHIANRSIEDGYYKEYEYWMNLACLESSGLILVQEEIDKNWCKGNRLDWNSIRNLFR